MIDNLERALAADVAESGGMRAGVEMILKQLLGVATSAGLIVVDPLGEPFDPERHQAMSLVEGNGQATNTVVAVFQKGYVLNDRLLRPAMVNVAQ